MTDTELIDYMESLKVGYGDGWILRKSSNGKGDEIARNNYE